MVILASPFRTTEQELGTMTRSMAADSHISALIHHPAADVVIVGVLIVAGAQLLAAVQSRRPARGSAAQLVEEAARRAGFGPQPRPCRPRLRSVR